ncbi:MAG: hypothetical protein V3W41_06565 [Planctomycetota bacterium]
MTDVRAETQFARERVLDLLVSEHCGLVSESSAKSDGWRAEFIRIDDGDQFALWAHKPDDAPYICIGIITSMPPPRGAHELEEVVGCAAAFDLSLSFADGRRTATHLAARLPLSALNAADLRFHLENLEQGRLEILDWDERRAAAEEARPVTSQDVDETGAESDSLI